MQELFHDLKSILQKTVNEEYDVWSLELDATAWRFLSVSAKSKATVLPPGEKLVIQDNFRRPMHIRVPFPVWVMNPKEAAPSVERVVLTISTTSEIATY